MGLRPRAFYAVGTFADLALSVVYLFTISYTSERRGTSPLSRKPTIPRISCPLKFYASSLRMMRKRIGGKRFFSGLLSGLNVDTGRTCGLAQTYSSIFTIEALGINGTCSTCSYTILLSCLICSESEREEVIFNYHPPCKTEIIVGPVAIRSGCISIAVGSSL